MAEPKMGPPPPTSPSSRQHPVDSSSQHFFMWKEFVWGGLAGAFGEGVMHPIDTIKTRLQSQAVIGGCQNQKSILQMVCTVWRADGLRGFYRGVVPGLTGSLATGATYFGVIESTKIWIDDAHPSLGGHWSHFIAGGVGDTLGSFVYVPCEVMKQRMQIQGTQKSWSSATMRGQIGKEAGTHMYSYYTGMFQAGSSIWRLHGLKGLYAGYWSTLARDVPFAGLMVTFYEGFKGLVDRGMQKSKDKSSHHTGNSLEGLVLGGLAGGISAYLTTPLDVIKTRLQVQGPTPRYSGWSDAIRITWRTEGLTGIFRGSIPRVIWYVPASALTFMAVEFLRDQFNDDVCEVASFSIDSASPVHEVA